MILQQKNLTIALVLLTKLVKDIPSREVLKMMIRINKNVSAKKRTITYI